MIVGRVLGWLLTWLTVIVGWMVVADQQAFRELRKDRSAKLDDLRDALGDVERAAIEFHTAPAFSAENAFTLRRAIGSLSREISMLVRCRFMGPDCELAIIELRQACTEANQDEKTFQTCAHASERVGRIMAARDALDDQLSASLVEAILCTKPIIDSIRDIARKIWSDTRPIWAKASEKLRSSIGAGRDDD